MNERLARRYPFKLMPEADNVWINESSGSRVVTVGFYLDASKMEQRKVFEEVLRLNPGTGQSKVSNLGAWRRDPDKLWSIKAHSAGNYELTIKRL
jgi:hypothetical protein